MSIEKLLTRVAEALEANTDAMTKLMESGAKSSGGSTKASTSSTKSTGGTKASSSKTTKSKGATTAEDVADTVGKYLKTGSKAERDERKGHVKAIIDHYDVDRFTNIDPESFDEALGYLKAFENGEDPFDGGGQEEEEDEDGAMV
tara:strand:- start:31203 stop:31637 length:435 start_codon:yes stop_codon:yes gene_type:complete